MDQKVKAQNSIKVRLVFLFLYCYTGDGDTFDFELCTDSEKRINQVVSKLY